MFGLTGSNSTKSRFFMIKMMIMMYKRNDIAGILTKAGNDISPASSPTIIIFDCYYNVVDTFEFHLRIHGFYPISNYFTYSNILFTLMLSFILFFDRKIKKRISQIGNFVSRGYLSSNLQ